MATALQAQLAQIASKSTKPLDLKAHRKAYSKSLLFEPSVATQQDVDTLYDICMGGYRELCDLDIRFKHFGRTLFSEQSKREDRSIMTSTQSDELDTALETFMDLLEARLLLKPAIKALEWLIRHFRVHEHNTAQLLCIFLPYHSQSVFSTLLSILPRNLPKAFQFLAPCVERLRGPSRQELVYAAIRHPELLRFWNAHVLKQCQIGFAFAELTSYWASVFAEATMGRIEHASRGNRASQEQKEGALLLEILPTLNEGLQIRGSPELRIGCYMVLTVLATRMTLTDDVLAHMMEAVVSVRTLETKEAELICLSVLCQRLSVTKIPRNVYKVLRSNLSIENELFALKHDYDISKLTLSIARNMLRSLKKKNTSFRPSFFVAAVAGGLLSEDQSDYLVNGLFAVDPAVGSNFQYIQQTLSQLSSSTRGQSAIRAAIESQESDLTHFGDSISTILALRNRDDMELEENGQDNQQEKDIAGERSFGEADISELPKAPSSFLTREATEFQPYYQALESASVSEAAILQFCDIKSLHKSSIFTKPVFMSFFVRVWCGPYPDSMRIIGIKCVHVAIGEGKEVGPIEAQVLIPYLLHALADHSAQVRDAAVSLTVLLSERIAETQSQSSKTKTLFGGLDICGKENPQESALLPIATMEAVMTDLVSRLEECRIDQSYLAQIIRGLFGVKQAGNSIQRSQHELKSPQKDALFSFLTSQIITTPLHAVRLRLLGVLNDGRVTTHYSKSKQLLALITTYCEMSEADFTLRAQDEGLEPKMLAAAAFTAISAGDREGLKIIQEQITPQPSKSNRIMRSAALERLHVLWPDMKQEVQASISIRLLESAVQNLPNGARPLETESLELLQRLDLHWEILQKLLGTSPPLPMSHSVQNSPSSKRRKVNHYARAENSDTTSFTDHSQYMRRVAIIVELIDESRHGTHPELIASLFELLADLHHIKDTDSSIEYAQVRILEILNAAVRTAKKGNLKIDPLSFRADLIVDYFRNASNAQMQQSSLLLLSTLASFVPDQVIHSIMPVFTYMGSSILRYSDDYSAHVIDKTIKSIIPPLISSLRKDKRGPLAGAAELLLSFTAAFEHIPIQRRHELFLVLADKLGPEEFLYALIIMLLDKHGSSEKMQRFALDLVAHYPPEVQLRTTEYYLAVLLDAFKPKPVAAKQLLSPDQDSSYTQSALAIASLPVQLFKQQELFNKLARVLKRHGSQAEDLRMVFARILQNILKLQEMSLSNDRLHQINEQLLDASLGLLPLDEAIKAVEPLLLTDEKTMKRDVLRSLESRIAKQRAGHDRTRDACLHFLHQLQVLFKGSDDLLLKQSCISCIDVIAETFGKSDTTTIADVAIDMSGEYGIGASHTQLRTRALLCLTTLVEVLEDAIISTIPISAPTCLSLLEAEASSQQIDENLVHASYSFFNSLLLYIPYIVTGEYLDRLLQVSFDLTKIKLDNAIQHSLTSCVDLIPRRTGPHECLGSLMRSWEHAKSVGSPAVRLFLSLIGAVVDRLTKAETLRHASTVTTLCLSVLDLRCSEASSKGITSTQLQDIEEVVNETLTKMIYKMNDAHFRPVFTRLLEWSSGKALPKGNRLARSTSLYSFIAHFFGTLKSIVTSYGSLIVDDAAELLKDQVFPTGESSLLWNRIIQALSAAFEYDQDGFWQVPSRFGVIMPPLIMQLERAVAGPAAASLISCITNLAQAADSTENLKAANSAVISYMRSSDAAVRLNAVRCQQSLTEGLGDDWLTLLPEMLPFISEAMEDDDEDVETDARAWIRQIEEILGESLDSMLQ